MVGDGACGRNGGAAALWSTAKQKIPYFQDVLPFDRRNAPAYTPRPRRTRVTNLRSALFLTEDGYSPSGGAL